MRRLAIALGGLLSTGIAGGLAAASRPPESPDPAMEGAFVEDPSTGAGPGLLALPRRSTEAPGAPEGSEPAPGSAPVEATAVVDEADNPFIAGWIEVRVHGDSSTPAEWCGRAYALAAGAPGVSRQGDVPGAAVRVGEPARFPVARAGEYDVGVVWDGGRLLRQDAVVGGPSSCVVELDLPPMAPITCRLCGTWPRLPERTTNHVTLVVHPAERGPTVEFPGRAEGAQVALELALESDETRTVVTPPLPTTERFRVDCAIRRKQTSEWGWTEEDDRAWEYAMEPREASGGADVRLLVQGAQPLRVVPRIGPSAWPSFPARMVLQATRLEGGGEVRAELTFTARSDAVAWGREGTTLSCLPGRWRVSGWGASLWFPPQEIEVRALEPATMTLDAMADPEQGTFEEPSSLDDDDDADPRNVVIVLPFGIAPRTGALDVSTLGEGDPKAYDTSAVRRESDWMLKYYYRGVDGILTAGSDWACRPSPIPKAGAWVPPLEPGGFAVYTPCTPLPASLGPALVRRADLFSIAVAGPTSSQLRKSAVLAPGVRLGPFPVGPMRLLVRVAGVDLPEVVVDVRAGATTPFDVTPR